jgi:SulP family sulfate permease
VLDCSAIIDIEYTALKMLTEAETSLQRHGVMLWLAALNPDVLAVVNRSALGRTLGRERMCFNLQTAVEKYEQMSKAAATPNPAQSGANQGQRR